MCIDVLIFLTLVRPAVDQKQSIYSPTQRHHFIPPEGSGTSVRVTSNIPTKDVILMLIAKYKVCVAGLVILCTVNISISGTSLDLTIYFT